MDFMTYLHDLFTYFYDLNDTVRKTQKVCVHYLASLNNFNENRVYLTIFFLGGGRWGGLAKVRSKHVHMDIFHFLWCISMIYQYLGRKHVCLCWLLNIICVRVALPAKNQFFAKNNCNLWLVITWELVIKIKKKSGIHIDHKRYKIYVKMKDFWNYHYSMLLDSYKIWLLIFFHLKEKLMCHSWDI